MRDQPRREPLEAGPFFRDGRSAREPVPGTVARGQLRADMHLYEGLVDGKPAPTFPFPVDRRLLARGRERFDAFCSHCHDRAGYGDGMVVQRGFRRPPSFHLDRLRKAPPGHLFGVITNGFGAMPNHRDVITPRDRWAIVAYIRALQLSQHAALDDVPDDARGRLR
jgi:mono/diheme cytochrome c family protein